MLIGLLSTLLMTSSHANADTLSELDIYKRCYVRMVRAVPLASDTLYKAVQAGTKTGSTACIELFDRAAFGTNGVLKNQTNTEARAILKTFNDLHRSWFQSKDYTGLNGGSANLLIHDIEQPALYYTRAAFLNTQEFKTIVTLNSGLRGVRVLPATASGLSKRMTHINFNYNSSFPYANDPEFVLGLNKYSFTGTTYRRDSVDRFVIPAPLLVDTGALVGVAGSTDIVLPNFYGGFSLVDPATRAVSPALLEAAHSLYGTNFVANRHMGGGIMGSQTFLLQNTNLGVNVFPNEYSAINRRLAGRIFEDLMCHQMPTLTDADVASETQALVRAGTPHMFQKDTSCMRCHSSIDGMGFAMRNLVRYISGPNPNLSSPLSMVGVNVTGMLRLPAVAGSTNFALQAPVGRLHYRELLSAASARPKDFQISSLSQLGTVISQQNDIYYCAAKRYYQFLTGIDVDLTQVATKPLDKKHQNIVKTLGASLKSHQKVRTLLYDIFKSETFRNRNYGSVEEQ